MEGLPDAETLKNLVKDDPVLGKMTDGDIDNYIKTMQNLSPEDLEEYSQYQKTMLSMGMPSCRIMMMALLQHTLATDIAVTDRFFATIEKSTNVEKVGGMNIQYLDTDLNKQTYCYIIMNKCDKNHDALAQFDKIQKFFDEKSWMEILKNVSMIIYLCRNIYKMTIATCQDQIFSLGYDINDVEELKVDNSNLTLYIDEDWDDRVGVYIMRESDLDDEHSASAGDTTVDAAGDTTVDAAGDATVDATVDTTVDAAVADEL